MADARKRRKREALRFKPTEIHLLLVAEAPPASLDRYFYFDDVREHDSLFRYVCRGVLGIEPDRAQKAELLVQLRARGVFLIDLQTDPVEGTSLRTFVPDLVERCRMLQPRKIVLIKGDGL